MVENLGPLKIGDEFFVGQITASYSLMVWRAVDGNPAKGWDAMPIAGLEVCGGKICLVLGNKT